MYRHNFKWRFGLDLTLKCSVRCVLSLKTQNIIRKYTYLRLFLDTICLADLVSRLCSEMIRKMRMIRNRRTKRTTCNILKIIRNVCLKYFSRFQTHSTACACLTVCLMMKRPLLKLIRHGSVLHGEIEQREAECWYIHHSVDIVLPDSHIFG